MKEKKSMLNTITIVSTIIACILYAVGLCIGIATKKTWESILSMSADYVTICSCILLLIQLIAFVKDSRLNEYRARKEFALNLANEYSNELIKSMVFIETVISNNYDSDHSKLKQLVYSIDIKDFTKEALNECPALKAYADTFEKMDIDESVLDKQSLIYNVDLIPTATPPSPLTKKAIANDRFLLFVSDVLNKLERFAMAVNQNVAESDMIFESLHQTYLNFVKFMYAYICMLNKKDTEDYYTNVIELYRKWESKKNENERIEEENKEEAKSKTSKERKRAKPLN